MTDFPLLLSTPLVRQLMAGNKTMTRRIPGQANTLVDGRRISPKVWKTMLWDMGNAIIDPGPSPAGNSGPYLKVPVKGLGMRRRGMFEYNR